LYGGFDATVMAAAIAAQPENGRGFTLTAAAASTPAPRKRGPTFVKS
jgi:hypothetical protein